MRSCLRISLVPFSPRGNYKVEISLLRPPYDHFDDSRVFSRYLGEIGTVRADPAVNARARHLAAGNEKRSGIWQPFPVCKSTPGDGCVYLYLSRLDSRRVRHIHPPHTTATALPRSPFIRRLSLSARKQTPPFLAIDALNPRYTARGRRVLARYSAIVQSDIRLVIVSALASTY